MIPAKRSRFFVHCLGRSETSAARSEERRRGRSRTAVVSGRDTAQIVERD
jgi:hypothetical protein